MCNQCNERTDLNGRKIKLKTVVGSGKQAAKQYLVELKYAGAKDQFQGHYYIRCKKKLVVKIIAPKCHPIEKKKSFYISMHDIFNIVPLKYISYEKIGNFYPNL
ncbi:BDN_1c_G0055160.mRNA.1.CDS.1 [Saccharomyces cerevisiae]|nr:BDN_1c_G0055160.mRNA.1.CDS.1 [Saccharomyces cerevisiae]CAI7385899.1 BDN_1c_G0055160.mRNA.1.CDS.1 [Saccharomyces cerevisiae]